MDKCEIYPVLHHCSFGMLSNYLVRHCWALILIPFSDTTEWATIVYHQKELQNEARGIKHAAHHSFASIAKCDLCSNHAPRCVWFWFRFTSTRKQKMWEAVICICSFPCFLFKQKYLLFGSFLFLERTVSNNNVWCIIVWIVKFLFKLVVKELYLLPLTMSLFWN